MKVIFSKKKRKSYLLNIILISFGFFVIVIFTNYLYKFTQNYLHSSYNELRKTREVVSDNDVYEFINEIFSSDDEKNGNRNFRNLMCFSIPHSESFISLIDELPDSIANKLSKDYLKSQIDFKTKLWDKEKIENCNLLTPSDLGKVDEMTETNGEDYWINFRKLYGNGQSSQSVPLFNKDKTIAIIQIEATADFLLGYGTIIVYIKKNGKWIYLKEKQLWIS